MYVDLVQVDGTGNFELNMITGFVASIHSYRNQGCIKLWKYHKRKITVFVITMVILCSVYVLRQFSPLDEKKMIGKKLHRCYTLGFV